MNASQATRDAREQFVGMMSGESPARDFSVEEAKARLRAVDAELDIAPLVQAINRGDWTAAGIQFGALWLPELDQLFKPQNLVAILNLFTSSSKKYGK